MTNALVCGARLFRFREPGQALLRSALRVRGMEDKFGEILVPTEEVVEMREGQKRTQRAQVLPRLCAGADGNG